VRAALFLACLAFVPASGVAQPTPPSPTTDLDQRKAQGLRLAQLLYPEELQVGAGINLLRTQFGPSLLKDSAVKALEAEHPGLIDAIVAELEPVFKRFIVGALPDYHRGIGDLYGANFSTSELTEIHRFFSTPTGKKISQGVQINMSMESVMDEAVSNPDAPATSGAIDSDHRATVAKALKSIDKSDTAELLRFGSASWFPKLKSFRPKLLAFETEFMNRPSPELEAEIGKVMDKTMQRFIAAAERKKAA
jgi:hypothetical protein